MGKRQPLQWCRELHYLDKEPIRTLAKPKVKNHLMQTFPGHYIKSKIKYDYDVIELEKKHLTNGNSNFPLTTSTTTTTTLSPSHISSQSTDGLIALASFPGSGNTWLRYLIQQSTGKMQIILKC